MPSSRGRFDNTYTRGKRTKTPGDQIKFKSKTKQNLSNHLQKYQEGCQSIAQFRMVLQANKIDIGPKLAGLLRRHESGDTVSFTQFGREIFK